MVNIELFHDFLQAIYSRGVHSIVGLSESILLPKVGFVFVLELYQVCIRLIFFSLELQDFPNTDLV